MDFAVLPPEINSGRMYAGPGAASMLTAAAVWDELAAELYTASANYSSVVSGLTSGSWRGASSTTMAAAAAPYVAWMSSTAAQAEQTGAQAKAAAAAHSAAYAMTVPPPVIAANRAQLASLVATNVFGQNTPAIAATEALYGEMWAQDATAMLGYATASQTASQVTPFTPPKQTTNPGGLAAQNAAATQSAGMSAGQASVSQALSAAPQALQALTSSSGAATTAAAEPLLSFADITGLSSTALFDSAIIAAFFPEYFVAGAALPSPLGLGAAAPGAVAAAGPLGLVPVEASASLAGAPAAAAAGEASSVSGLSVPKAWATAAPEMRLAAAEFAMPSVASAGGAGGMLGSTPVFGGAPLMGLGGRGATGTRARDDQQSEEAKRKAAKGRRSTMR